MGSRVCLLWALPILCLLTGQCAAENQTYATFQWFTNLHNVHHFKNFSGTPINESCQRDMDTYVAALKREELWALKMFDSSGRYSSQFFFGNDYWLGSQTLCNEISNSKTSPFLLSFNVVRLRIQLSYDLTPKSRLLLIGVCFPSSCERKDISEMLKYQYNISSVAKNATWIVENVRRVPGSYTLWEDKKFLALGGSVLIVIFLMIIGTIVELLINRTDKHNKNENDKKKEENGIDVENNNKKRHFVDIKTEDNVFSVTVKEIKVSEKKEMSLPNGKKIQMGEEVKNRSNLFSEFFLSFSIFSNGSKILNCSNGSRDSINSVHGLRFLSLAWVVLVHTYLQIFAIGENKGLRALTEKKFIYQIVGNATYSVDSFFVISGLLVSYLYFKSHEQMPLRNLFASVGKFFTLILYRFVRLTPVYIVVIGMVHFTTALLKDITVFETPLIVVLNCDNYWWRNILYVNNFFPRNQMCMLWSWYMAADTQFFVLSAIFLLLAKRYFRFSFITLLFILLSSWCTTAYIAYTSQFRVDVRAPLAHFDELYDKPWTRIGPYIIGIYTGWLLYEKKCKIQLPLPMVILGWIISLGGLLGLVFCIVNGFDVVESSVYAALGHTAWGLCLAWIVMACQCGYGGWINSFLSWPAFLPFSRLTFCAYLVHPVIMFLTNYVMDGPFHMHNGIVVIIFLGNLISSFLLSFILSLAFEAPFVRILKIIMSPQKKR